MKLLITGGAGFIGSALVRLALARGYQVINLDALTYAGCLENLSSISDHPAYHFENVDICDRASVDGVFRTHRPDAVIHLAAESHVDQSIAAPGKFIDTNVTGTYHLLEAARQYWLHQGMPSTFRFQHISTDEVFGSLGLQGSFNEETRYDPRSPYAASKAASDHLVRAWHETYGLPILLTTCSNNYGPYQFPEKLIPVVIINACSGRQIPVYGDGHNVRDWLFVEDHAEALLFVLEQGMIGRSYNIGGRNEQRNIDLVHDICTLLDRFAPKSVPYAEQITFVKDRAGHDRRYAIDPSRIEKELSWTAKTSFQTGLENTVRWYLENEAWWRKLQARNKGGVSDR
ncbi:MAG: dTDP-glucose 4,6-dehydratase [Pseudomonadota bacterium]